MLWLGWEGVRDIGVASEIGLVPSLAKICRDTRSLWVNIQIGIITMVAGSGETMPHPPRTGPNLLPTRLHSFRLSLQIPRSRWIKLL